MNFRLWQKIIYKIRKEEIRERKKARERVLLSGWLAGSQASYSFMQNKEAFVSGSKSLKIALEEICRKLGY